MSVFKMVVKMYNAHICYPEEKKYLKYITTTNYYGIIF